MIFRFFYWVFAQLARLWNGLSLILVLSVAATVPFLQLASLGYMLHASAAVAQGKSWRECFAGAARAGGIVACGLWMGLSWLPVWLLADYAYAAELIDPGSAVAGRLRFAARAVAVAWVVWAAWAVFRGGRWWHFLWPQPIRLAKSVFRRQTWRDAEDRLWEWVASLRLGYLLKLGFFGTLGALLWLAIPASMMIVALTGEGQGGLGLIGLVGAMGMVWVLLPLPFLPIHMAVQNRWRAIWDRRAIRTAFRRAPIAHAVAVVVLVVLAVPLYLLRIESIPSQLLWILSVFFVVLMFPAKLIAGWALRRSQLRERDAAWPIRWIAWLVALVAIGVYVGFLYVARFTLWEGAVSILLQHAFLPPIPFYLR